MEYGQLKPEGCLPRISDSLLESMLATFGAVEVAGTMWCGKTWTSLAHGQSVTRIGLSGPRMAAEADPSVALIGPRPHVIDEWQDVPAIWDEVRASGAFSRVDLSHGSYSRRLSRLRKSFAREVGLRSRAVTSRAWST